MIDPVTASAAAEAGAKSAGSKAAADMAGASIVNPMTATAATSFPVVMSGVDLPLIAGATNYGTAIGSGLAAAAPAASTILGLTPTQWGQQALFRGGDALLKGIGESRVNDARDSAISRHEQFIMDSLPARDAAFSSALTPFDRANFDQAFANKKAEMISEFDATRPQFTFAQAPDSTPQEVKSDITRRRQEARDRGRASYSAMADMNALSSLLGLNSLNTADQAMKMSMAGKPNSTSAMQMKSSLADADKAGNLYSAMGDISSGIGSLVLANQLSKKGG